MHDAECKRSANIYQSLPFHDKRMITGIKSINTTDLRLRHCVFKSLRNNVAKAC